MRSRRPRCSAAPTRSSWRACASATTARRGVRTWLHEHERDGLRSADWYLAEAGVAMGTAIRCWRMPSTAGRGPRRAGSGGETSGRTRRSLDLAIAMTKELEQQLALA